MGVGIQIGPELPYMLIRRAALGWGAKQASLLDQNFVLGLLDLPATPLARDRS